jgi:exonuclease VII large subunit
MTDLSRAYGAVHAANRGDVTRLSNQFDSVRERLAYLRDHPDLSSLESTVLEVAAQMLHVSNELTKVYSNDRVTRPRDFLDQRQSELQQFNERLGQAKMVSTELKHRLHKIELEESVAATQLERLPQELKEVLPELGIKTFVGADNTIVELTLKAAE